MHNNIDKKYYVIGIPDSDMLDAYEEELENNSQGVEAYETDGLEENIYFDNNDEFDSDEEWENRNWEVVNVPQTIVASRCHNRCINKIDPITLDPIRSEDNPVLIDKQCYNSNILMESLGYNNIIPHNRKRYSQYQLRNILERDNMNECLE